MAPSEFSRGAPLNTAESLNSRKADGTVEQAPPSKLCCLSVRGKCCFMVVLNLIIIVAIFGFLIVIMLPFFEPIYLWIFGVLFSVFGFLTLMVTVRVHMGVQGEQVSPESFVNFY